MTLEQANEVVKGPLTYADRRYRSWLYVEGQKNKKANPIAYEMGTGFKAWLRTLDGPAPESFRARLYGEKGQKAATTLQKVMGDGSQLEFPECSDCGQNVPVWSHGLCRTCYDAGLAEFRKAWPVPEPEGDAPYPTYTAWLRAIREAYEATLQVHT